MKLAKLAQITKKTLLVAAAVACLAVAPHAAQAQGGSSGTGKTMAASVLASDLANGVHANVAVYTDGSAEGTIRWRAGTVELRSGAARCSAEGPELLMQGTVRRMSGGILVAMGDGSVRATRRPAGGGGADIIVFDIIDSIASTTIESPGRLTMTVDPCS
jgi:hypothetical protein